MDTETDVTSDRQAWTGVVLCGGQSTRMGRDKALIEHQGQTLLQHALQKLREHTVVQLVIGEPAKYAGLHAHVLPDDAPGQGPLGGLCTALAHAPSEQLLVLACDVPNVSNELLQLLQRSLVARGSAYDAAVPVHGAQLEPLVAAYHRRCLPSFRAQLAQGRRAVFAALERVRTQRVAVPFGTQGFPEALFKNLNTPQDLPSA